MRLTVVGGGVIGLLTAVEGVLAGHQVTLLDQGDIPYQGAASFDRHRMLRALHPADPDLSAPALRAHERWIELERLLETGFYHRVGALTVRPRPEPGPGRRPVPEPEPRSDQDGGLSALLDAGARARRLAASELVARYPNLTFPGDVSAVLETEAGVLLADRVLAACVGWLRRQPAAVQLQPHRPVERVDGTAVRLAGGAVVPGDAVVLAAGPWSRRLLPPAVAGELSLWRQSMIYCEVPRRLAAVWSATPAIPSFGRPDGAWLVPPAGGTPLKISAASACRKVERVTGSTTPDHWRDHLIGIAGELVPEFRASWVTGARDCHYLSQPSADGPRTVALGDRVVALAACGGVSFKFAPLIARSLVGQAAGQVATADRAPTGKLFGWPAATLSSVVSVVSEGGSR